MARGINKVILVGNLGADPETRYTPSGTAITSIRIATSESWKDKTTGEQQERTEWHRIEFFGRIAEIAGESLKKGRQVYVEGKLRTDEYEKEGVKRWSTKIIAESLTSFATWKAVAPDGRSAQGLSNQTSFLRPILTGTIHATARRRHRGRTTWVWEVDITDDEGRLCALVRITTLR